MLLKAIDLENKINEENLEILQELKEKNIKVKLLSIRVGDDYGSILYEKSLEKTINSYGGEPVSYTHLTLPTTARRCRSRWSPYH